MVARKLVAYNQVDGGRAIEMATERMEGAELQLYHQYGWPELAEVFAGRKKKPEKKKLENGMN